MPSEEQATPPGNPFAPRTAPAVPDHELLRLIGRGAYGEVWLARNATGTLRAVKIVHRQSFQRAEHFEREFKGLLKFEPISRSHAGLVHVLQIGRRDGEGYFFYVMELADQAGPGPIGVRPDVPIIPRRAEDSTSYEPRTLRSELQARGSLPPAECVAIGLKLASVLEHLHTNGLVHRDIKPSNIIFVKGEPKLADIGLVTAIDEAQSLVGTAGYIPPEGPGTAQADLYSLGKVLYEIAFGKDRQEFPQLPPDLQSHPDYAALLELNEVILKACETNPRQRYQSAEQLRADLELLQGGKSVKQKRTRQQLRSVTVKVLLSSCAVLLALMIWFNRDSRPPAAAVPKRSTNEIANGFYDAGRHRFEKLTGADTKAAAEYFEQAIAADPGFAAAHAGLAMAYLWGDDGWNDWWKVLRTDEARKAIQLDGSLSEPHIALGWEKILRQWDWKGAELEFQQAIKLNPSGAIG